ncbi:MAG: hypothetical protein EXX96DRAFT_612184 [Benjaminiella poitrasii]|nr:MAG: hypothetical protein EXX96DRAFT_612184 [Benjaminiella poitrasii]
MDIFILKLIYAELIYDQERSHCVKTKTTGLRISSHVFLDVPSTYIVYPPYNGIILVLTCLVMLNIVRVKKYGVSKQIQEAKVLNAELSHIRPTTALYERHVPSSNIFFLAPNNDLVKSKSLLYQKDIEKQLK